METKEIKITPPEGYEIDKENSTFECIKFKPKSLTYKDVTKYLFNKDGYYFINNYSEILKSNGIRYSDSNNATSEKQLQKLFAINKLMNVAKYLNGDWKPDWEDGRQHKFYLGIEENDIYISEADTCNEGHVYFKCPGLVEQAIDILGEDTIRLALSTDW